MKIILKPQAQEDLKNVLGYIARDNIDAALRMKDAFSETFTLLSNNPHIGTILTDLDMSDVRHFTVVGFKNYTFFYVIVGSDIEIIRLGYGGRDWLNLLSE